MRGEGGASGEKSVELYATFKTDGQQNSDDRQPGGSRGPQRGRQKADRYTDDNVEVDSVHISERTQGQDEIRETVIEFNLREAKLMWMGDVSARSQVEGGREEGRKACLATFSDKGLCKVKQIPKIQNKLG